MSKYLAFTGSLLLISMATGEVNAADLHKEHGEKPLVALENEPPIQADGVTILNLGQQDSSSSQNVEAAAIPQPKTKQQTWFSSLVDSIKKRHSKPQLITKPDEGHVVIKPQLESEREPVVGMEKEIGFLTSSRLDTQFELTYVNKMRIADKERYTLSFEGDELLCFNLPRLMESSSSKLVKNIHAAVSGQVLLPSMVKREIIENAINRTGLMGANHISMKNNYIVLDNKMLLEEQEYQYIN